MRPVVALRMTVESTNPMEPDLAAQGPQPSVSSTLLFRPGPHILTAINQISRKNVHLKIKIL